MNIKLPTYELVSLTHSNSEIRQYLKFLNQDSQINKYFPDFSVYIGKNNAYFIKKDNEWIGFVCIASTKDIDKKELMFAIDQNHRGNHLMSSIVKELVVYLFLNYSYKQIIITPMNPYSKKIAIENHFKTNDGFHYYIEKNESHQNKM